jgi:hypothetical protein
MYRRMPPTISQSKAAKIMAAIGCAGPYPIAAHCRGRTHMWAWLSLTTAGHQFSFCSAFS